MAEKKLSGTVGADPVCAKEEIDAKTVVSSKQKIRAQRDIDLLLGSPVIHL
jgi:hypothetical protein